MYFRRLALPICRLDRVLAAALLAAGCLFAPLAASALVAEQDPDVPVLVLMPPRVPPELAGLRRGVGFWLHDLLSATALEIVPEPEVRAALDAARGAPSRRARWQAVARAASATHLLAPELHLERGRVELRLLLIGADSGQIEAAARHAGPLGDLGTALKAAAQSLLEQMNVPLPSGGADSPSLAELASYARSLAHLERGELRRAYEELAGAGGPAANALRSRIDAAARAGQVSIPEQMRLAIAQGELDQAWVRVRSELRTSEDPVLLVAAGEIIEAGGNRARALELYTRAAELDPENGDALLARGDVLVKARELEAARVAYEHAAKLRPEDPKPLESLAELPRTDPAQQAQILLRAGALRAERFDVERAEQHYRTAARLDPSVAADAQSGAGRLQERMGRLEAAKLSYERAVTMGEEDPLIWTSLGRLRRGLEDTLGAEKALHGALERDPAQAAAHRELGELYAATGRSEDALAHLERAIELEPSSASTRRALAQRLHATGASQRALELLSTAESGEPLAGTDLLEMARIQEESGDLDAARLSLERAIALEPGDPSLYRALVQVHEARGDATAAEAVRLAGAPLAITLPTAARAEDSAPDALTGFFDSLVASFPAGSDTLRVVFLGIELRGPFWRTLLDHARPRSLDLGVLENELQGAIGRRFELDAAPRVVPQLERDVSALRRLDRDPERIARVNDVLETDAVFVAQLFPASRDPETGVTAPPQIEVRMLSGRRSDAVSIYTNQIRLGAAAQRFVIWNRIALSVYGLLGVLLSLPLLRGWGSLHVTLDYLSTGKGVFSIKIARRPDKAKPGGTRQASGAKRFQRRLRALGRFERHMVSKETLFRWLPARRYYVAVHGLLQDPAMDLVVGNYFEEKSVRIRRGRTVELHFDFRPQEATVEVRVAADGDLVEHAIVSVRGQNQSPKYTRDGRAILYLRPGSHVLAVGFDGRVLEKTIEIPDCDPVSEMLSWHEEDQRVFENCLEAVDPYLAGDMLGAAAALERVGQGNLALALRGEYHRSRGENEQATRCFEQAGRLEQAAELASVSPDPERSAALFEKAGEFTRAAEVYRSLGNTLGAARAYEAAYEWEPAIECYRELGEFEKVMELLEKTGAYFEAARIALYQEDTDRAISDLQLVEIRDPDYSEACRMLGEIFMQREQFDLAAQAFQQARDAVGGTPPLDLVARIAEALEGAGRFEEALQGYEALRRRDLDYPNVAARIEELRKRIGRAEQVETSSKQGRYEILGELGRGGMGVVLKARDRRLGRIVALKRLPENLRNHETAVRLFLREARAAAALNHPNIVTVFDADEENGNYFITMELLEGFPLNAILRKRGRLSAKDVARLGVQVAAGLQYAHERRIVHRDIKTANLFFTRDRVVKIMDFGLAKMMEEVRRSSTVIGGTPYYMAPEQAVGDPVDHRADLYSFGVTLFELLTGSVPFASGDVTHHHRHTAPPDPREKAPGIPDPLAALVLALLRKRPDDRPATTAEVGRLLQELAGSL